MRRVRFFRGGQLAAESNRMIESILDVSFTQESDTMKKGDKTSTENGVKRPSQIKDIVIPSQSDAWGDSLLMLSLMFGMAAILLKVRIGTTSYRTPKLTISI